MNNWKLMGALIGLAGAVGNNGKTEKTDLLVVEALLAASEETDRMIEEIHREKFRISPNCETCQTPCGNTSDYDLSKMESLTPEVRAIKEEVFTRLISFVSAWRNKEAEELPLTAYRAICYLGYDLEVASYEEVLHEMEDNE